MDFDNIFKLYGEAAKTSVGFFWKSVWAFILGYAVSAMIQVFVPKKELTKQMGKGNVKSVSLSTIFGTISSSCSFAALATARSLFLKGAHFIATVAFMFASTNLVIELGILIFIFLGWQFLAAEVIGGFILIIVSSLLIKMTYPKNLIDDARQKVESEAEELTEDFDWKKRIKSKSGWLMVGKQFVMEWKMAWQDILIGFTIAGFMAVLVPKSFWETIFLSNAKDSLPHFIIILENALVAPFVAASTFIGSMGNIPLATVLNANGVLFAGIMGFIYSDLMVPPLVNMNRKYYGTKVAFYIAGIMFVSIVITALTLNYSFEILNLVPKSGKKIEHLTQFKIDYTFWFNIVFAIIAAALTYLHIKGKKGKVHFPTELGVKRIITYSFGLIILAGIIINFV